MPFCINHVYNHGPSMGIPARRQKPSTAEQFINISTAYSSHSHNMQSHNGMSLPSLLSHFGKHKCWGCLGFLGVSAVYPTLWLVSACHHLPQLQLPISSTGWMRAACALQVTQFPSHLSSEPSYTFLALDICWEVTHSLLSLLLSLTTIECINSVSVLHPCTALCWSPHT